MKNNVIRGLVLVNVALLAALLGRAAKEHTAVAQQAVRPPTDVIMIPGTLPSGSVLYLVDVGNHRLSAMAFDQGNIEFLSPAVDLDRVFQGAAGAVGNGAAPAERGTTTTPPRTRAR
jgi:hypothetical protein